MNWRQLINQKAWPTLAAIPIIFYIFFACNCGQIYAGSDDVEFVAHGASVHFNQYQSNGQKFNGKNPGFGIRLPLGKKNLFAFQGGVYKNSYSRTTLYAGVDWLPIQRRFIALGAGLGAATGYTIYNGMPIPIGGPVVQWKTSERLAIRFRVFPPVVPRSTGAISFEFSWRFHKRNPANF